jgi:uncharacterized protein YkwD
MKIDSKLGALAAAALAVILTACGGGGGGEAGTTGSTNATPGGQESTQPTQQTTTPAALVSTVAEANYSADSWSTEKTAVFNVLNDDRARCGFGRLAQNAKLDAAAQAHAIYQATTGTFGHDETAGVSGYTGNTPIDRIIASGYRALFTDENTSTTAYGTFYTESRYVPYSATELGAVNTLRDLYASVYHLAGLMDGYREVGIGISVKNNSTATETAFLKVLNINSGVATGDSRQSLASDALATFPCEGISNLNPYFLSEQPDPFPDTFRDTAPYGQPIYLTSASGTSLNLLSGTITKVGTTTQVATRVLTSANDPQKRLAQNQVFLVPTNQLDSNAEYSVELKGTSTSMITASNQSGAFTRSFTFRTGTFTTQ